MALSAGRRTAALLGACALACCGARAAQASPTQESVFMDDNLLLYRGDAVADRTLAELRALGVDRVRLTVPWRAFAPAHRADVRPASFTDATDPAQYDPVVFDLHDHVVRVARRLGIGVLLNVTGGAPLWATGTRAGRHVSLQFKPDARAFGQFVQMLATRYDGTHTDENQGRASLPRVDTWSIWNEPNAGALLQPQWERSARPGHPWVVASARIYRRLVRAATAAFGRTGHAQDTVLLGETAPRGLDVHGTTRPIRPVVFLGALLCLDHVTGKALRGPQYAQLGCSDYAHRGPLAVSGYAHHPYSIVSAPDVPDPAPADITLADAPRLRRILDAAAALRRIPAGLAYWWTEFGWQTDPPDPIRGVAPADQARWLAQAEQITRADPRAAALTQFLLRDDLPRDEPGATSRRRWGTYQSGLEFADASRKPAYDAYRLPLVASPAQVAAGATVTLWGLVRPLGIGGPAEVRVEFAADGSTGYLPVGGPVAVDPVAHAFSVAVAPQHSGRYRFSWSVPAEPIPERSGLGALLGPQHQPAPPVTYRSVAADVRVG